MKKLATVLLLAALSAPAFAQSAASRPAAEAAPHKAYYVCWYGDNGNLADAQINTGKMKISPYFLLLTGRGGNHAWAYEIHSTSGRNCPSSLPQ